MSLYLPLVSKYQTTTPATLPTSALVAGLVSLAKVVPAYMNLPLYLSPHTALLIGVGLPA